MTDFPRAEYEARLEAANRAMHANNLDAILLASEAEVRYFTGFRTQFWQSPTRPWFVILRRDQTPLAIIPEIGAELMARSDIAEIEAWPAPRPHDDGLSLLKDRLANCQRLGVLMGHETTFRMPLNDVFELRAALHAEWIDATDIIRDLRMVKSDREIAYIRQICGIASQDLHAFLKSHTRVNRCRRYFGNSNACCWNWGQTMCPIWLGVLITHPMTM